MLRVEVTTCTRPGRRAAALRAQVHPDRAGARHAAAAAAPWHGRAASARRQRVRFRALTYSTRRDLRDAADVPVARAPVHVPHRAICRELIDAAADVICLQEVQRDAFEGVLMPRLGAAGSSGLYKQKTREDMGVAGKVDGCALFWRKAKFRLSEHYEVEFNEGVWSAMRAARRMSEGEGAEILSRMLGQRRAARRAAGREPDPRRRAVRLRREHAPVLEPVGARRRCRPPLSRRSRASQRRRRAPASRHALRRRTEPRLGRVQRAARRARARARARSACPLSRLLALSISPLSLSLSLSRSRGRSSEALSLPSRLSSLNTSCSRTASCRRATRAQPPVTNQLKHAAARLLTRRAAPRPALESAYGAVMGQEPPTPTSPPRRARARALVRDRSFSLVIVSLSLQRARSSRACWTTCGSAHRTCALAVA